LGRLPTVPPDGFTVGYYPSVRFADSVSARLMEVKVTFVVKPDR
jgi:hypothetical protein